MVNRINEKRTLFTMIFGFLIIMPSNNIIGHFYGCYDLQILISIMQHYDRNFYLQYLLFKLFLFLVAISLYNYLELSHQTFSKSKKC